MSYILVIEDDLPNAAFMIDALEEEGYPVVQVMTGAAAMAQIATRLPQLIICDRRLPDMDGLRICQCMKAQPTTAVIPIVFCSAGLERLAESSGYYSAYLEKPFDLTTFLALVAQVVPAPTQMVDDRP